MDYFYVKPEDVSSHGLLLRGDESKHAIRVLRKTIGDRIFVTDGNDTMFEAVIAGIGAADTRCDIAAMHRKYNEPAVDVTLAVSVLKNPSRFDFLVEKTTELGIRTIIPLVCERTVSHHDKHQRLEKIACAAMKQCGRSWLPRIQPVQQFDSIIHNSSHWQWKFIPHEKADPGQTLSTVLKPMTDIHSLLVVIGPEGGFSEEEIRKAKEAGFLSVSLGLRRLRTETAAVIATIQSQTVDV
jgi:16S rRNA (uracil1498-N3)-methyltransferase